MVATTLDAGIVANHRSEEYRQPVKILSIFYEKKIVKYSVVLYLLLLMIFWILSD